MHSAITAIDVELTAAAAMMNKSLTYEVQYFDFYLCEYVMCIHITLKVVVAANMSCGHILYAKITPLLNPLHIRPDLY